MAIRAAELTRVNSFGRNPNKDISQRKVFSFLIDKFRLNIWILSALSA